MTDAPESRRRSGLVGRIAVLGGLAGLAIAQPLLDLLGRNPEFFVAGHYEAAQIVTLGVLVVVVPWLAVTVVQVASSLLHRRLGDIAYVLMVGLLGLVFGCILARGLDLDAVVAVLGIGAAAAVVAIALTRMRAGAMFLQLLAVANVAFLVTFLFASPTSRLIDPDGEGDLGTIEVPEDTGPVVVVVLDELPITTLMKDDGSINGERYPNFARLAERSTWFRNASSRYAVTDAAAPALLTGQLAEGKIPTWQDHPRNLLSLFGGAMPVERYEIVTDLCPPAICDPPVSQPMDQAIRDSVVVYAHRALPSGLRDHLPAIDHSWGSFTGELGALASGPEPVEEMTDNLARWHGMDAAERSAPAQAAILADRGLNVDEKPAVHLIHVALPHNPWVLTPWGTRLTTVPKRVQDESDPAYAWSSRLVYQMHAMQVGAADAALGLVLDHFDEKGLWDEVTLVVASDHGTSLVPPNFGRVQIGTTGEELFRIPMFVHNANLDEDVVVDDPAQAIDLLPTLVDLLDIRTDWTFDGHSLLDGSRATVEPRVTPGLGGALAIVDRHRQDLPHGWDWDALAAVGEHGPLVGTPLGDLTIGAGTPRRWGPDFPEDLEDLPGPAGRAPQVLTGLVYDLDGTRPPELVVSVNGTIGGVLGGYQRVDGQWRFATMLAPYLVDGANDLRVFEVEQTLLGVVLHPLVRT